MKSLLLLLLLIVIIHNHEARSETIGAYSFIRFSDTTAEEYRPGSVIFIAAADSGKKIMAVSTTGNKNFYYYRSEDYGQSWEMFFKDTFFEEGGKYELPLQVKCIEYPSEDYCVIGLDSGRLMITEDFGQTLQLVETGYDFDIDELIMIDDQYGIAMLRHKKLDSNGFPDGLEKKMLKTTDGWQTWSEVELHNDLRGILDRTLFMLGKENIGFINGIENDSLKEIVLFISRDGGESWQLSKAPDVIKVVRFRTSNEIYTMAAKFARYDSVWLRHRYHPVFMKSNNNGTSWDTLSVLKDTIFGGGRFIESIDENTCMVLLSPFKRYVTNDGGQSWYLQDDFQSEMKRKSSGISDYELINENFIVYASGISIVIYDNRITSVSGTEEHDFSIFPNPAVGYTNLSYTITTPGSVSISIHDILGRKVKSIFDGYKPEGGHTEYIGLTDLPAGVYYIALTTGGQRQAVRFSVNR